MLIQQAYGFYYVGVSQGWFSLLLYIVSIQRTHPNKAFIDAGGNDGRPAMLIEGSITVHVLLVPTVIDKPEFDNTPWVKSAQYPMHNTYQP